MTRILLVNPHETFQEGYTNPPLGILYIAGMLLKHGFEVRVVDGCLEGRAAVRKAITEFRPDMVGVTCLTPGRKKAIEVASMAKEIDPSVKVVMGGAHATIMYEQMMAHYPQVDYIVLGEGENACLEIAQGRDPSEIAGIVYRDNGKIVKTAARKHVENLDDLPFPAWHLIDLSKYSPRGMGIVNGINLTKEPRISVIYSRGCTGHCSFCSSWWIWKGWRHRSACNMVDELEMLNKEFGIKHFCFADDALTIDRQATIDLCDEIMARKLNIAFFATTRADCVDEEVLRKLKEAGCYELTFGVETASRSLLKKMGKECEVEHAEKAIRLTEAAGIRSGALLIVGNVGETDETIAETLDFLRETQPSKLGYTGGLWILPGTKLYNDCKKQGFIDDDFWLGDEPYKQYTLEHSPEEISRYEHMLNSYMTARYTASGAKPATFGAVYCVYDDDMWLTPSLESVYDSCDGIWFLVSDSPWNGEPTDNSSTLAKIREFPDPQGKIHLVQGDWKTETDQRNAGLEIVREAGMDYCFVVDADEIFDPASLRRMMEYAASNPYVDYWHVRMITYWKSCYYRVDPIEPCEPVLFLKAGTGSFSDYRRASEDGIHATIPMEVGFYHHMSYARTDDLVRQKITTFSHADEMQTGWYENVWLGWDSDHSMVDLHPVYPPAYHRAVPQPYEALPSVLQHMVESDSHMADARYSQAQQMIEADAYDDAETVLTGLVEAFPPHAQAHNDLGVLLYQKGDMGKAVLHLDWAVLLNPDDLTAKRNLTDIYAATGGLDEATALYQRVLAANPNDADAVLQIGHLHYRAGNLGDALDHYRRALRLDPGSEQARRHVELLVSLISGSAPAEACVQAASVSELQAPRAGRPRIIAIFAVFNEGDIIRPVIKDLISQDIECYILDHNSTDNSVEQIADLVGKGIIGIERFPQDCGMQIPDNTFSLRYILMRKEQLVRELGPAWYINADVDEFRESPWPGLNLREGIERVDAQGYNAINFAILDFKPTDNSFVPGDDVRKYLTHYSDAKVSWDNMQVRCWKHWGQDFTMWQTGGHLIEFEGRRIYSVPFILRHYAIRSQQHGEMKIFNERKKRFDQNERAAQWHVQYDTIVEEKHNFLSDKSELEGYDRDKVCAQILRRYAGIRSAEEIQHRMNQGTENLTSIVILAYNQLEYTKQCLESVRRNTHQPYELVIVDNGSMDGTPAYLHEFKASWEKSHDTIDPCQAVKVICHDRNLGYAAGNNSGIEASEGAYVCILNNDIVVAPGWLEYMTQVAESDPRIGIVGPMSNNVSGSQRVPSVPYDQDTLEGMEEFAAKWTGECGPKLQNALRLVGFCMLIKRPVIDMIGGLDTRFGLGNYEDDDFCIRASIAGFHHAIACESFVHHFGSRTFKGERIDHEKLMAENWTIFKAKWGLPQGLPLRAPYDISALLAQPFDPDLHYVSPASKSAEIQGGKWFAAPDWAHPSWEDIVEQYIRSNRAGDGSLLQLYAGYLTASDPDGACEKVTMLIGNLNINEEECPDIEITTDLPHSRSAKIILMDGALDDKLQKQFPGQCIPLQLLSKAA